MKTKADSNAFPQTFTQGSEFGLTKREYMATAIVAGMMANKDINTFTSKREIVSYGIEVADKLIETLSI